MAFCVLVVDDNQKLCKGLSRNFQQLGYEALYALNSKDALEIVQEHEVHIVLQDVSLGEEDGLDVLAEIKNLKPSLPVIMITGFGTILTAVHSIKAGAYDYIQKPLEFNKLLVIVENALKMQQLNQENEGLRNKIFQLTPKIVTQNQEMIGICNKAERLASTDFPILIQGESGTGKEGMAEFIHNHSPRYSREIVRINCAAFPENLLDNELFGHEKGAYTGADQQFKGVFEKAQGTTLLLDEVGDMSLSTQAKILRALQNNEIRRIGGESSISIDVRFIASTNKNLEQMIEKKLFREDLYYRLSTATIWLPPLRDRKDDIPLLVESFLENFSGGKDTQITRYTPEFMDRLMSYNWPGNIRELKNSINYASAISLKDYIDVGDLPPMFSDEEEFREELNPVNELRQNEKILILKTLQKTNFNKKRAAEILHISRNTLYNKLERYGI